MDPFGLQHRPTRRTLLKGAAASGGLAALSLGDSAAEAHASPEPAPVMRYGMGGTAAPFAAAYAQQVSDYRAASVYVGWTPDGTNPTWSRDCADVPDRHDIVLQFSATTRGEFDATLATFPRTRTGKVYVLYLHKPEDDVQRGRLTLAQWQRRTSALYAAVDAAGLPYVVKSVGLRERTLRLWAEGGQSASGPHNPSQYIRPGCQHIGLAMLSTTAVQNGHVVATVDPVAQARRCGAFARSKRLPWSNITGGMALRDGYRRDQVSVRNRVRWLRESARACSANGARHYLWFDLAVGYGSYRLADDPALEEAWLELAPLPPMRFGVGGTADPFDATYAQQRQTLRAENVYVYWPPNGQNPSWSRHCASVPDDHDIILQFKASTRAAYDASLATFPRNRTGKVYVHYWNEPEDQIRDGVFTLAEWQQRTDALYAAVDAANLPYVVKSVELMDWTLVLWSEGGQPTNGPRNPHNYIRPGCEHIALSVYAEYKIVDGHAVPKFEPVEQAKRCAAFARARGLPWSNAAGGMPLPPSHERDPQSIRNRIAWLRASTSACAAQRAVHYNWFDLTWPDGNYRIADDPALHRAWLALSA